MRIEISGKGGEFQHHYLSLSELKDILEVYNKDGVEGVVDDYFSGGRCFERSNFVGAYGCNIGAAFKSSGKKFKPSKFTSENSVNDARPFIEGGNIYHITTGKLTLEVELDVVGKFDPMLLEVSYVEFDVLESSRKGTTITRFHYNGEEIPHEITDVSGEERYDHVGCIYEANSRGDRTETNIFLMRGADGDWMFDADVISRFVGKR